MPKRSERWHSQQYARVLSSPDAAFSKQDHINAAADTYRTLLRMMGDVRLRPMEERDRDVKVSRS